MKSCSTCFRREIVMVKDQCWGCWSAVHRRPRAAAPLAGGLALVVRPAPRPPRRPLLPLPPSCWACGATDTARGCIVCFRVSGGPPRGGALAVPVEVPVQPQPQGQAERIAS